MSVSGNSVIRNENDSWPVVPEFKEAQSNQEERVHRLCVEYLVLKYSDGDAEEWYQWYYDGYSIGCIDTKKEFALTLPARVQAWIINEETSYELSSEKDQLLISIINNINDTNNFVNNSFSHTHALESLKNFLSDYPWLNPNESFNEL